MMRALLLDGLADRPRTRLADRAESPLGDGEVRVRIEATALNPLDAKIAIGAMTDWFPIDFPYVPGTDFAGVVEAIGDAVGDLAIGDRVFGRADPVCGGAVATCIVIDAGLVARRPETLSAGQAACLPTPAGVALQVLDMLSRTDDEPLMILGDGMVARMVAALAGDAARLVTDAGDIGQADHVRHAIDTSGGPLQAAVLSLLPSGSHLVTLTVPADATIAEARGVRADFAVLETSRAQLDRLAFAAERGVLRPHIDHVVAFEEAASVFDRYVARAIAGKIVIEGASR